MVDYAALIDEADAVADPGTGALGGPANAVAATEVARSAAAAPDVNPWASVIDQADAQTTSRAQLGLYAARDANPDKAARAAQLGGQLGVAPSVVESDLPTFEQRARLAQNAATLKGNPALASWVAENPLAPRVAADDFGNLDFLSRTAREWTSGWSGAVQSNQLARLYYQGTAADPAKVADLEASMRSATADPAASGLVHGVAGLVAGLADLAAHGAPLAAGGAVTGAAIGATAAGLPTAGTAAPVGAAAGFGLGAAAGFGAGVFTDAFKIGFGNISHTLDQVRDAEGNRIDPIAGFGAALLGGLASGALNTFGLHLGGEAASQAASGLVSDAVRQAVSRPTVVSALGTFAGNLGKAGLTGGALGAAMEGSNVVAEEAAKQLSAGDFATVFNDPATRQAAVNRIAESAASMALTLGALHGIGGLPPLLADGLRARQASDDLATFSNLEQGAAASKVRGRSPSIFQDWIARHTDGTPVENLFIPARRVAELYQSLDVQPGAHDGLFGDFIPDIEDQLREGSTTGGDVVVPTSGYLTHLAGTDVSRQLQPDIRVRQDGMSLNDAAQFHEAYSQAIEARNAELQQQADEEAARVAPAEQVANEVRTQASAAGFGSDAAAQYAALYGARYATRGERLGVDPLELFRNEGVQIERAPEPGLTATAPDGTDLLLNHIRQGAADPTMSSLYGRSLLEFLAHRGGVEDPDGDLKAMGAADYHKGKPGTRRLVRPDRDEPGAALPGMNGLTGDNEFTPDAAARAAWEEGYFPGADRPDVSQFYDAVRDELAGRPRYSEHGISRAQEFGAAADDLERQLHGLGIDPAKATNAEIKRVLDQHHADGGGRSYEQGAPIEEDAGSTDLRPAGTRRNDRPGNEAGGAAHDQSVVPLGDGVNLDVGDPAEKPAAEAADGFSGNPAPPGPEAASPGIAPERRGSIQLSDGRALITLFAKRDLSTLLHESGHLWLDELVRDAAGEAAPEQLRGDLATIMRWMGVEKPEDIGPAEHEQFARGFERYLMEGKAPSAALRGAFGRFKAWLTRIYKTVAGLNVAIDPNVRGVFDRLLASDAEIDHTLQAQGLGQLFRTAADAGMTEPEFAAYQASVDRVRSEAVDGLSNKVLGDVRRQRTAAWREAEAPIRDDVTAQVDARPDMKALRLLRTGKPDGVDGEGERIRLDRQAIVDAYGSESVLSLLPKRVPPIYTDTGGMHPDFVAELVGQRSGSDLLQSLMAHEAQRQELRGRGDARSVRQYLIDDQTYARMVERHGDALRDGSIESDALDQVHGERQLQVLGTELRALGRRTGQEATPTQVAKAWAERSISEKTIKAGTQPGTYLRAEAKAGRAALRAMLAGDHAEAFRQKQAQLLNHALYMAANAASDDVQTGMARFQRFGAKAAFPTIETGYVDRIHDLLRRFHMPIKRDSAELDRALGSTTLERWATDRIGEGHEIYVAPDLYDGTFAKPIDTLSVTQFRDLADTVKSIAHVGRGEQSVILGGIKAERDAVKATMIDQLGKLPQRAPENFVSQGGRTGLSGLADKGAAGVASFHAMLLKPEAIIDRLDSDDPNGIFNKAIWRPIKAAQGVANDLRTEVAGRLRALRDVVGKDYGRDFDRILPSPPELIDPRTGAPMALKRRGLVAMALNVGNESNLQRLVDGYGWTREGVKTVLDRHMTDADWRYVQGTWDTFESLFPRIEDMQRRMTGVGLEKVQPREVETAAGTLRGGYYPVVYDPNLSLLGDRIKASGDARFEADYARATTPKGHTVARVDAVNEPLSLNPDLIHWKLGQATHDLAYREAIVNADKLLRDKGVMNALDRTIGRDQRKQLDTWLQSVANERNIDTRGLAAMDAFLHRFRTNTMVVGIGFRASTMVKHGMTALSNSVGELGAPWLMRGATEFFGSGDRMARNYAMITGKSAEMRYRMDSIDRDVREVLRDLQGKSGAVSDVVRFSHYGVASLDMLSALPTWLGAYRKAEAQGMEEADAVAFADKLVRNAHGANGVPDLAAIQRGGEAQKLLTMFYGFFNHIYNRQVVGARALKSGAGNVMHGNFAGARRDFAKAVSTFFFYLAVPAIIEGLVSQGAPPDDENPLGWAAKQVAGEIPAGIPLLRDLAKAAISGRGYEMSPVARAASTVIGTGKDVASLVGLREKPPSRRWVQHAIETPGYILGLPTGQVGEAGQFLADVSSGEENPQDVSDWLRGMMYGPAPKHAAAH